MLRDRRVPTVATVHNYRLICAGGTLFRDGRVCHDCLPSSHRPGVQHGCYRESRIATTPVALANVVHARHWKALDALLTLSSAQRDLFVEAGYDPGRVIVKPNFVTEHPGSADHGLPGTGFVYAGRLADTKGVQVILDAWAQLDERGLRPELTIIGSGPLEDDVVRFADITRTCTSPAGSRATSASSSSGRPGRSSCRRSGRRRSGWSWPRR